ncbi:uncharacterized protein LOC126660068 [Mercurialis annua]|uniref:uncharacterized protein LOC126660068 n=1 Tax=Mercurialis annua TaxID=3986 RepID=UPI00215EDE89|nr:uncharacterized protein LOC126660068 [Mercurialis annua]
MTSLVDYASSSDDDVSEENKPQNELLTPKQPPLPSSTNPNINPNKINSASSSPNPSNSTNNKLPDASILLNSSSILSSISVEPRKRDSTQMAASASVVAGRSSKLQKGKLLNAKNKPDTEGGLLIPPQLLGKSNIVTEDISKLFVQRKTDKLQP